MADERPNIGNEIVWNACAAKERIRRLSAGSVDGIDAD
jgi:hypothetical protein